MLAQVLSRVTYEVVCFTTKMASRDESDKLGARTDAIVRVLTQRGSPAHVLRACIFLRPYQYGTGYGFFATNFRGRGWPRVSLLAWNPPLSLST